MILNKEQKELFIIFIQSKNFNKIITFKKKRIKYTIILINHNIFFKYILWFFFSNLQIKHLSLNTIQSKIPSTNRNKKNGPFFGKKLNTIYNKSIGALKISNKNCRVKILNNNNSKNKIFAKSLITKENFGY